MSKGNLKKKRALLRTLRKSLRVLRARLRGRAASITARIAKIVKRIQHLTKRIKHKPKPFTPLFGADFTNSAASVSGFQAAGVKFVCRYLSGGTYKDLAVGEAARWAAAGIKVVVVWETTATRALGGHAAGVYDAQKANAELNARGKAGAPIYFAVDFDVTPAQKPTVVSYFEGVASVLGKDRTGIYGGYWAVKAVLDAGTVKYAWQTYAWSGTNLDPRAQLYQYSNGHYIAGTQVDYDKALTKDFGGF
jgi:hypothetical protein